MQFLREKNFKQTIPPVKIDDGQEISYENASAALKRAVHFYSALQASDGHWPAENAGPLFFLPPLVSFIIRTFLDYVTSYGFQIDSTTNCHVFNPINAGILYVHYRTS